MKHKGKFKYSCDQCEYQTERKINLKTHKETKHDVIYRAPLQDTLKTQKKCIDEGIKFTCSYCKFKASKKANLDRHQQSKHEVSDIHVISVTIMQHDRLI